MGHQHCEDLEVEAFEILLIKILEGNLRIFLKTEKFHFLLLTALK